MPAMHQSVLGEALGGNYEQHLASTFGNLKPEAGGTHNSIV